ANNIGTSADSTFMTASITQSSNQPINTVVPIKAIPTESVPPTIVLTTSLQTPFKQTPTIRGEATDNEALAGIEYSTDGGQNWLPTDGLGALPSKKTTFSFTPVNLDDGNYAVLARAIDTSGNTAKTATATLVIDRLPPQVGGNVISLGPQILTPDKSGVSRTLVGIDQKITLSAVGGPTAITLTATSDKKNNSGKPMSFSLAKSADTGLWSGILVFTQPGNYSLTANSIDGAGNKTSRIIQTLQIQTPAQVIDTSKRSGLTATVTAYYFEPELREWAVWDGGAYGQKNPQTTGKNGAFALMLPPGKYYFKTTAGGYRNLVSTIFTTDKPTPITSVLAMKKKTLLAIGNDVAQVQIGTGTVSKPNEKQSLAGHVVPSLSLQASNGQTVNSLSWLGKPTVLTLTSIWSPATAQQVPALTELQKNTDINVVPVAVQERIGKTRVYSELSGYKLQWLADSDSALTNNLKVQSIPTHYFVDRKGIVRKTITGTLTKDEILESLTNL
ncbi:MAG TPA: redoxin domain-containing protein, partial [Candidatus Saccharimonadales bacterium]|nr:redoxin domain-containing protein [Candidatus Saccharimonadales bacterium]